MARPKFATIAPAPLERFRPLLGERFVEIERAAEQARQAFAGRTIWHVNSTMRGGGVAELLRTLLPYVRGAGVDTRWVVLREASDFFAVTKRLHNRLHGDEGDGGALGEAERRTYEETLAASAGELLPLCRPGDVVYLHDPQTAGLTAPMREAGMKVVWRCHVGADRPNDLMREAWDFLRPFIQEADAYVFSRREYLWEGLDRERTWVMPPVIDPFSPKNEDLGTHTSEAILRTIGLVADGVEGAPVYTRTDGTPSRVEREAAIDQAAKMPGAAKLVAQVSRWDRLKDPVGLIDVLADHLPDPDTHLVLAGPDVEGVADDPEQGAVHAEAVERWAALPEEARRRVHLVSLPMFDVDENGAMVNAIQRRADVVVQKSLAEGFGLTVAEAMWKGRPVVASRVGGIQDQVLDGETGILVEDPHDLAGFGEAIASLLADPGRAARMGEAGRRRVADRYLAVTRLREYVQLVASLV